MSKNTMRRILLPVIILAATVATVNIRPAAEDLTFSSTETKVVRTELHPASSVSGYKVMLSDGAVCLYTLDSSGNELDRTIIDYIDIYSLYPSQIDMLLAGANFENRESAAEFIQDLGS
ncbi:MAG: hypothetical protein IKT39_03100 [Clostridia bacterium]|nr:hypothetical protein [Clostridia bacterium]